jgi:hypothetical protein
VGLPGTGVVGVVSNDTFGGVPDALSRWRIFVLGFRSVPAARKKHPCWRFDLSQLQAQTFGPGTITTAVVLTSATGKTKFASRRDSLTQLTLICYQRAWAECRIDEAGKEVGAIDSRDFSRSYLYTYSKTAMNIDSRFLMKAPRTKP